MADSSLSAKASASEMVYPFLAMQADQAVVAFLKSGSVITSLLISLFIVSMPPSDVVNWASWNAMRMLRHLPAAACAPADRALIAVGEPLDSSGPPVLVR